MPGMRQRSSFEDRLRSRGMEKGIEQPPFSHRLFKISTMTLRSSTLPPESPTSPSLLYIALVAPAVLLKRSLKRVTGRGTLAPIIVPPSPLKPIECKIRMRILNGWSNGICRLFSVFCNTHEDNLLLRNSQLFT